MDTNQINNTFNQLRSNISEVDSNVSTMIPVIAGRLQIATQHHYNCNTVNALIRLKKELRNFNIQKRCWDKPI